MPRLLIRFLPIILIFSAVIVSVLLSMSRERPQRKAIEPTPPLVNIIRVNPAPHDFMVQSQGLVTPKHKTIVSSQVSGRVNRVADVFIEGGMVNQGDVLIELEKADYETDVKQARAELARAQAALQEELARAKVAEVEWQSIQQSAAPELGLRKPQLAKEQASVLAAEAGLERAERNLSRTTIVAPYDGIVKQKAVEVGQFVGVGTNLGMLFDTRVAQVRLPIKQSDYAYLTLTNNDTVAQTPAELEAMVAGSQRLWMGQVTRDEGLVDEQSRVMFAVVDVQDPYNRTATNNQTILKFGTFVKARITGKRVDDLYSIPRSALRVDNTVLLVDSDDQLVLQPVVVVKTEGLNALVSSGLSSGQRMVTSTLANPKAGTTVSVNKDSPTTANAGQLMRTSEAM